MMWLSKNWWKIVGCLVIVLLLVWGVLEGTYQMTYSDGNVVGRITQFRRKGTFIKTEEGILDQGGFKNQSLNGQQSPIAYLWNFSVTDPATCKAIDEAQTHNCYVKLHYRERMITLPWHGEEAHVVDKCEPIQPSNSTANFNQSLDIPPPVR